MSIVVVAALSACTPDSEEPGATPTSASAAAAASGAPQQNLEVQTREIEFNRDGTRPLPTKVWLPAGGGPYPLIYFSHGLTSQPDDYADLLNAWAQAGFVVAAPRYPNTWNQAADFNADDVVNQPADAQFVITEVLKALPAEIDPNRIAAAGHSAGAITTVGLLTSSRDERLKAGVLLAGRQMPQPAPFSGTPIPLLFIQGKQDTTVTYEQAYGAYNEVTWPKAFMEIPQGTHLPHRDQPAVVATTTTDFWRWSLYGDEAAKARLPQDASATGAAALTGTL
ncbi:alpha/beta hydrolase family protein [Actinoplanes aureus]|uniref:Alpha/beta hydrolase n=1 Tax=Actinoplanes aureus TaxID=2792083 RepID=A0A931C5M0_9ACTN|nr:alpha/beta hydrolase [Actinoplanes aureus]MBG0561812.1 alpha/beta hydrolase [Actinoplanes aureus]